jgi:hypothetical protein
MITRIQLRRGPAAEWESENTLLAEGEIGVETDTGKFKIGNGSDPWNDLPYGGAGGIEVYDDSTDRDTENPDPAHGDFAFLKDTNLTQFFDGEDWQELSADAAKGAGGDKVFLEHEYVVNNSYTITENRNVISAGPIIVEDGAIVTVPEGSNWVVV